MSNSFIVAGGVFADGYGFIPKSLMRDSRLTIEAKAIYAYLSSFAGSGMQSFPSVELMVKELGISRPRLYKHREQLIELGYISIQQSKDKESKFSKNIYVINPILPQSSFMSAENLQTENLQTENVTTNSNSSNSNSLNSNSKTNTTPDGGAKPEEKKKPAKSDDYPENFLIWWELYPNARRSDKKGCFRKWRTDKLDEKFDFLIEKLKEQVAFQYNFTDPQYIPRSTTYLNQSRYNDEVIRKGNPNPPKPTDEFGGGGYGKLKR